MKLSIRMSFAAFLAGTTFFPACPALAQTTWVGATSTWNDGGNWSSGVPTSAVSAIFSGAGSTAVDLGGASNDLQDLTFNAGAQSYTFSSASLDKLNFSSGGFITVSPGVTQNEVIGSSVGLNGPFTITNNGTRTLTIGTSAAGTSLTTSSASTLTVGGSGSTLLTGLLSAGAVTNLVKTGSGTLTLKSTSNSTIFIPNSGSTTISGGGTLVLDYSGTSSSANILGNSSVLNLNGGTINWLGTRSPVTREDVDMKINVGANTFTSNATGITLNSVNVFTRSVGATLNVTTAGTVTSNQFVSNTLLGAYATVGGADWAFWNGTSGRVPIIALSTYTTLDATVAATVGDSTKNYLSTLSSNTTLTGGNFAGNSLKLAPGAAGLSLDLGTNNLTLANGGLLFTGANAYTITGTTGLLNSNTATDSELVVQQWGTAPLTISAPIANGNGNSMLTKSGAGTLILSGNNTYSGATYVNAGMLQFTKESALYSGVSGSWTASTVIVNAGGTLAFNVSNSPSAGEFTTSDIDTLKALGSATGGFQSGSSLGFDTSTASGGTFSYSGNVTDTNGLANSIGVTKLGTNTLLLSGANSYSGGTTILGGAVKLGANNAIGTGSLTFGDGSGATGNLDLDTFDQTISSLSVKSNSATANTITIGSGKKLTVTGAVTVGVETSSTDVANLNVTGGTLEFTGTGSDVNFGINGIGTAPASTAAVDLTGLALFKANVNAFNVSKSLDGAGRVFYSTLKLSNTSNDITANSMTIADSNGGNNNSTGSLNTTLTLGAGGNVIKTDTLVVGQSKARGDIVFALSDTTGTLTLGGKTGSKVNITLANNTLGNSASLVATLDTTGHTANVTAGTLNIGASSASSGVSSGIGTLYFNAGTFTVDTLNMAAKTAGSSGNAEAYINIGGGNFTVNPSGSVTMGSQAGSGSALASINITGGTLTSNANFVKGAGTVTSTVTLDGGTLNMTGHSLADSNTDWHLNFKSGTLSNVLQINAGSSGLVKTTSGILTLAGTNSYTSLTLVQEGRLNVNGTHTLGAAYSVSSGATLGGTGSTDSAVTVDSGGFLAPGASVGTLTVGSAAINGTFVVEYDNSNMNKIDKLISSNNLDITNTTVDFDNLGMGSLTGGPLAFATYGSLTTNLSGTFASIVDLPANYSIDYHYAGNQIALVLAGDYNENGYVDAADYVVWRKFKDLTSSSPFPSVTQGNGNGDNTIDNLDYDIWRANFGSGPGPGSGSGIGSSAAVPEPGAMILALVAVLGGMIWRRAPLVRG